MGAFLCLSAEQHPEQKEEKIGAALIKAQARVSSAVNSKPGGTANQWTASSAIAINSSRSEQLKSNKKEGERHYWEAPTTCAEHQSTEGSKIGTKSHEKNGKTKIVQATGDTRLIVS